MMRPRNILPTMMFVAAMGSGCLSTIDTDEIPSIEGYTDWARIETSGDAPPHGDAARVIYANSQALAYRGGDNYPLGTVIVKEILVGDFGSELDYLAIMRRLEVAPSGGTLEDGWLFSRADELGADELQGVTCFDQCHVQAPFSGTWFDYGTLVP